MGTGSSPGIFRDIMNKLCDYPYSSKNKEQWLREKEHKESSIKEHLAGLIGIPMIFDGNALCPECLHHSMDIFGGTYFCKSCNGKFPATPIIDKWGERWLKLNDV